MRARFKKKLFFLCLSLGAGLFSFNCFGRSITLVTYYPTPKGVYQNLESRRMAVGQDVNMPPADGQIKAGRSVIHSPQDSHSPNPQEGEMQYVNSGEYDNFFYYEGASWIKLGPDIKRSGCYIAYHSTLDPEDEGEDICAEEFNWLGLLEVDWYDLGPKWGYCVVRSHYGRFGAYFLPVGKITCSANFEASLEGDASLCCR